MYVWLNSKGAASSFAKGNIGSGGIGSIGNPDKATSELDPVSFSVSTVGSALVETFVFAGLTGSISLLISSDISVSTFKSIGFSSLTSKGLLDIFHSFILSILCSLVKPKSLREAVNDSNSVI